MRGVWRKLMAKPRMELSGTVCEHLCAGRAGFQPRVPPGSLTWSTAGCEPRAAWSQQQQEEAWQGLGQGAERIPKAALDREDSGTLKPDGPVALEGLALRLLVPGCSSWQEAWPGGGTGPGQGRQLPWQARFMIWLSPGERKLATAQGMKGGPVFPPGAAVPKAEHPSGPAMLSICHRSPEPHGPPSCRVEPQLPPSAALACSSNRCSEGSNLLPPLGRSHARPSSWCLSTLVSS